MNEKKTSVTITERGVRLLGSCNAQQETSLHFGEKITIEVFGEDQNLTIGQKCPVCKFCIRGPNHCQGDHHRKTVPKRVR